MHTALFYVAIVWLLGLLAIVIMRVLRQGEALERLLLIDTSTLIIVALLLVQTLHEGTSWYLDPALVVALLSFLETVVVARFVHQGGLFR